VIKIIFCIIMLFLPVISVSAVEYYSYENVLGTSFDLYVDADKSKADQCCSIMLKEIDRLNRCLSTEQSSSEISLLNSKSGIIEISRDLYEVLKSAQKYQNKSNGSYSLAISPLTNLWKSAVLNKTLPSPLALQEAIELTNRSSTCKLWETNSKYYCQKNTGAFNLYSLAKGYIMDKSLEKAGNICDVESIILNIGGDILCRSKSTETVLGICDPFQNSDNAPSLSSVKIKNGALATSGNYARYFEIQDRKYSHIIDGRSGKPVEEIISASVWATNAVDADALATVANILKPEETLKLINSIDNCECLLVSNEGEVLRSENFSKIELVGNLPVLCKAKPIDGAWGPHKVSINFKLENSTPKNKKRFHKHYTLVWVEDSKGKVIRHLAIWIRKKKTKYLRSMKKWWSNGGQKKMKDKKILATSRATRPPGSYTLTWDGLDDNGKKCKSGLYTFHIEVCREKGPKATHVELKLNCGKNANKQTLKDQTDLSDILVEYK
jgi:thiamine biosynthesis lipoprotein